MSPRADSRPESRQAAVIDLGSNSVRLVIYRVEGRAIWTVFNEKALAGLGRDLPVTGKLAAEGGATLALGPFALGAPRVLDIDRTRRAIEAELGPVGGRFRARSFHAVGGAWRNLALLHMEMVRYPLRVAHQYEMSRADAVE